MSGRDLTGIARSKPLKRPIVINGDTAEIHLTRGFVALIDAADVPKVELHSWCAHKCHNLWYAVTKIRGRHVTLHRLLLGINGPEVDHRDGNGLNCRRENLRECTHQQNARNRHGSFGSSRFKGVSFDRRLRKWKASISANGKYLTLGRFDTEELAAAAYDEAAVKHYGEFACTNAAAGF